MLPSELWMIVLSYLSRKNILELSIINHHLRTITDLFFERWALTLIKNDIYFTQLPLSEVVRYLRQALVNVITYSDEIEIKNLTSALDKRFNTSATYKILDGALHKGRPWATATLEELYHTFYLEKLGPSEDIPKFVVKYGIDGGRFGLMCLSSFSDQHVTIRGVHSVQTCDHDSLLFLVRDGSLVLYHPGKGYGPRNIIRIPGSYQKISSGYALTTEGNILCIRDKWKIELPSLPKITNFDIIREIVGWPRSSQHILTYINEQNEAWSYYSLTNETRKIMDNAQKVLSCHSRSFVLSKEGVLYCSCHENKQVSRLLENVVDISRHSIMNESAIHAVRVDEVVVYSFNEDNRWILSSTPRLRNGEAEAGYCSYVIEY